MNVKIKLENFARISEEEAENRRIEILKEIDEKVNQAVMAQERVAKEKAAKDINDYRQKAASRFNSETVAFRSDARLELLKAREELFDKLYSSVEERLLSYTDSDEYVNSLTADIKDLIQEHDGAVIYLTKKDMGRLSDKMGKIPSTHVTF
ncbi:MAG: V-type ATP synthase subunit E, partial [Clostridiales bacterium]|nr:V-type ATP synthase subunit E [Clostridiales bacterium]